MTTGQVSYSHSWQQAKQECPNYCRATTLRPTCFLLIVYHVQAFATYLLIAWLTSNIIFAQVVSIVSALEWQVG